MKLKDKKAVVIHSGGMDSSLCLALAIEEFGREQVHSLSFHYGQRHSPELIQAKKICEAWGVSHTELPLTYLAPNDDNALTKHQQSVVQQPANTLVVGRNGMMTHIGGLFAYQLGAQFLYLGIIEADSKISGYRDCNRPYMDFIQKILQIDFDNPNFEIRTPLVHMTKKETMYLGQKLGILEYLLEETITCYQGIPHYGCGLCLSCRLRNEGIQQFLAENPSFSMPYEKTVMEIL